MAAWSSRGRMKAWWRRTGFTRGWPSCNSRGREASRPPLHPIGQSPGRILVLAGDGETLLLIEADGAGVVLVHLQIEPAWREPPRFGDKRLGDTRAPGFRSHHDLVEIKRFRVDRDKAGHGAGAFRDRDLRLRH